MSSPGRRPRRGWYAVPALVAVASVVVAGVVVGRLIGPWIGADVVRFTPGSPAMVELTAGQTRTVYVEADAERTYRGRVDCRVQPLEGQPDARVTGADGLRLTVGGRSWRSVADVTPQASGRVLIGCFGPLAGSVDFAVGPDFELSKFLRSGLGAVAVLGGGLGLALVLVVLIVLARQRRRAAPAGEHVTGR